MPMIEDNSFLRAEDARRHKYPLATAMASIDCMWPGWLTDVNQWMQSRGIDWSWESNFYVGAKPEDVTGYIRFKRAQDQFLFELAWSEYTHYD